MSSKTRTVLAALQLSLLFGVVLFLFSHSVEIRKPWFGTLTPSRHQDTSASLLIFAKNWYRDGPLALRFGLVWNPNSVEFKDLLARQPYPTFPPGAIVPIYLLALALDEEPSSELLMSYNLANHFLIAFALALTVYLFVRQLQFSSWTAFAFALSPPILELLLPGPLYWHQNVYYFGGAAILPMALCILIEVVRDGGNKSRELEVLQVLFFCWGAITDWLFFVFLAVLFAKRFFEKQKRQALWIVPFGTLGLFFLQIFTFGGISQLQDKFLMRTGIGNEAQEHTGKFFEIFWKQYIVGSFGSIGLLLLLFCTATVLSLLLLSKEKNTRRVLTLSALFLLPALIKVCLLRQHSVNHQFTVLPFSLPIATIPFSLLPLVLLLNFPKRKWLPSFLAMLCFIGSTAYVRSELSGYARLFPAVDPHPRQFGEFIGIHTDINDIVFSDSLESTRTWSKRIPMSYSMKPVYKVGSLEEIATFTSELPSNYRLNFVTDREVGSDFHPLLSHAKRKMSSGKFTLWRIEKDWNTNEADLLPLENNLRD